MMTTRRIVRRLALLLLPALTMLLCSCSSGSSIQRPEFDAERLNALAVALGKAYVASNGTAFVAEKYPQLVPLLDANENGLLELGEMLTLAETDPAVLAGLVMMFTDSMPQSVADQAAPEGR